MCRYFRDSELEHCALSRIRRVRGVHTSSWRQTAVVGGCHRTLASVLSAALTVNTEETSVVVAWFGSGASSAIRPHFASSVVCSPPLADFIDCARNINSNVRTHFHAPLRRVLQTTWSPTATNWSGHTAVMFVLSRSSLPSAQPCLQQVQFCWTFCQLGPFRFNVRTNPLI